MVATVAGMPIENAIMSPTWRFVLLFSNNVDGVETRGTVVEDGVHRERIDAFACMRDDVLELFCIEVLRTRFRHIVAS